MTECVQRIGDTENDLDRLVLMNEVKFVGVPPTDNENLQGIFASIAAFLGFDTSNPTNLPSLVRLSSRDPVSGMLSPSPVIIVKFVAIHIKERFYGLYLNKLKRKENLNTSDLGLSFQKRIIIGENLTSHNMKIFAAASNFKRDGKLAQVYTVSGLVHVKLQRGTKPYILKHLHELETLISNPPAQTTSNNANNETQKQQSVHPHNHPGTVQQANTHSTVNQQPNNQLQLSQTSHQNNIISNNDVSRMLVDPANGTNNATALNNT